MSKRGGLACVLWLLAIGCCVALVRGRADPDDKCKDEGGPEANKWDAKAVEGMGSTGYTGWSGGGGGGWPRPMYARGGPAFGGAVGAPNMAAMAAPMVGSVSRMMPAPAAMASAARPMAEGIGFKTGGAQDVENFRENVKSGLLPIPTDVTYEGFVKDYYFDTQPSAGSAPPKCTELFCPTYSLALAPDPLASPKDSKDAQSKDSKPKASTSDDVFLAVGLDSGLTKFDRPRLNLAVVLDVSGSMDSPFDRYYYDRFKPGSKEQKEAGDMSRPKLEVAKEVLLGILSKLKPDDAVSVTLFSDDAATPKRMGKWGAADKEGIIQGIKDLKTVGSTNFQAGFDDATARLRSYSACFGGDPATTENRILVLTDAQMNTGEISETGLLARAKANAADGLYTTLVGIGLDFNTEAVEAIMKVKGANYFSVHTPGEFKRRLADEFDSAVSPLVFDLQLRVDPSSLAPATNASGGAKGGAKDAAAGGWKVLQAYGSPDMKDGSGLEDGTIMKVLTLFPSPKTEEGIKGGVVLLRMQPPPGTTLATAPPLKLSAAYTDRSGKKFNTVRTVQPPTAAKAGGPFFQSTGVRKAVALARLTDALQIWLVEENAKAKAKEDSDRSKIKWPEDKCGVIIMTDAARPATASASMIWPPPKGPWPPLPRLRVGCPILPVRLGKWERQSRPLAVGGDARDAMRKLAGFMKDEKAALKDATLQQEVDLLQKLADTKA